MGVQRGNQAVIASTMATVHEFPDRELFGEDVIWSEHETGLLSSHRILTTGTHLGEGAFGKPTGKRFKIYVLADCAAKKNTIFDEWLIRDYGGMVRQLGLTPKSVAKKLIKREGGTENCVKPFTPEIDIAGEYKGAGNDNEWGEHYAAILRKIMNKEFEIITKRYDRAVTGHYAGGQTCLSHGPVGRLLGGASCGFSKCRV